MKRFILPVFILILLIFSLFILYKYFSLREELAKKSLPPVKNSVLKKYYYKNLRKRKGEKSKIVLGERKDSTEGINSYVFYFKTDGKKASGLINLPDREGVFPVIVMVRGYVDREIYAPGVGTSHAGELFAQNGFITLAPDFLGYGDSDNPSTDPMEERFETYTTLQDLLSSIPNLNDGIRKVDEKVTVDESKIGMWAHSNGGQIALSTLEITGGNYPTVLWAPVSKPFPYSILYYTDEYDDYGKALRKVVSDFENDYDVEEISPINFLDWINAPLELHQGTADESVPKKWSDALYNSLKEKDKDVEYFVYPGADHNLNGSWNLAAGRSLEFFKEKLKSEK